MYLALLERTEIAKRRGPQIGAPIPAFVCTMTSIVPSKRFRVPIRGSISWSILVELFLRSRFSFKIRRQSAAVAGALNFSCCAGVRVFV